MDTITELYNIREIPDDTFPLSFNLIDRYKREETIPTEKIKRPEYLTCFFLGGRTRIE